MDREYIRQVESPITPSPPLPPKIGMRFGRKLAAGQRSVRGKREMMEGDEWIGKVGGGEGRERTRKGSGRKGWQRFKQ